LITFANSSLDAFMFPHQLPEIDMKFLNAYNLFAICDDYWGVLPMPFVLGGATFLLLTHF
jgi:hypothetical protein